MLLPFEGEIKMYEGMMQSNGPQIGSKMTDNILHFS